MILDTAIALAVILALVAVWLVSWDIAMGGDAPGEREAARRWEELERVNRQ